MCSTPKGKCDVAVLNEEEGRSIIEQALQLSRADDIQVNLEGLTGAHLRFARNSPSTSGNHSDLVLTVKSSFGKKSASATVNQLDAASIKEVVERSEQLARLAPDNPEHLPGLGPQEFVKVSAYDPTLLERAGEEMAAGSRVCIERARELGLVAAGFSEASAQSSWIGNRQGLMGYHRTTEVGFSETVRTSGGDGSGWACGVGNASKSIDYARCSAVAVDKAQRSVQARPLAPGKYVTILEPACVASLMQLLLFTMSARSADEGRSYFSEPGGKNKLGQKLFPESVTITSDPAASVAPGAPWGEGGLPQAPRAWIQRGRLEGLIYERFWAEKQGHEAVPPPSNLLMAGGSGSLEELIASTERGVLITSLWYIRFVDPKSLLLTGLTRDGVFWIENGKLAYPVTNFRWNDSPVRVLQNVDAMTASVRTSTRESTATNISVPALRVKEFELSSVSDAV